MNKFLYLSLIFLFIFSFSTKAVNPYKQSNSENILQQKKYDDAQKKSSVKSFSDIPTPKKNKKINSPGKIPSFWWSFILSGIGAYTIYGIALGPISVLVVYFSSHKNKTEVRKSVWGFITGTIIGIGVWALSKTM